MKNLCGQELAVEDTKSELRTSAHVISINLHNAVRDEHLRYYHSGPLEIGLDIFQLKSTSLILAQ